MMDLSAFLYIYSQNNQVVSKSSCESTAVQLWIKFLIALHEIHLTDYLTEVCLFSDTTLFYATLWSIITIN